MATAKKMYTRRGDGGETGLLYGGRVSKADPRCEAYGTLDEAVSVMGLARALSVKERVQSVLLDLQKEALILGGELAIDTDYYAKYLKHFEPVTGEMVTRLEEVTDDIASKVEMPREFIMPGGTPGAAAIDVARGVVRRDERRTVALREQGLVTNEQIIRYLNRLSSLLFVLARYEEQEEPRG